MAIQLKHIDETLSEHPYFKNLTEPEKIQIYNSAYQHFFLQNKTRLLTYWDVDFGNVNHIYSDGASNYVDEAFDPYVDFIHRLLNNIYRSEPLPLQPAPTNILSTYRLLEEGHIKFLNEFTFEQKRLIYHIAINRIKDLRNRYYQVESRVSEMLLEYDAEAVASLSKGIERHYTTIKELSINAILNSGYDIRLMIKEEKLIIANLSKGYSFTKANNFEFEIEANLVKGFYFPERREFSASALLASGFNVH